MDALRVQPFSGDAERVSHVHDFIEANLAARHRVFVVTPTDDPEFVRARLGELEGFGSAIARGAVLVVPRSGLPDRIVAPSAANLRVFHEGLVRQARLDGYEGVAACMDITKHVDAPNSLASIDALIRSALPPSFHAMLLVARRDHRAMSAASSGSESASTS